MSSPASEIRLASQSIFSPKSRLSVEKNAPFARLVKAADLDPGVLNRGITDWWTLEELTGRLVELSGGHSPAVLTVACLLVLEAQRLQVPVVWVSVTRDTFFPPDMAENGVDLGALPVVWASTLPSAGRAADWLIRSGAFGLAILDLRGAPRLPSGFQARLLQLSRKHRTALVCLTGSRASLRNTVRSTVGGMPSVLNGWEMSSLGSLVSLRGEASWKRINPSQFLCELRILKDKRRGPGWKHAEVCHGPVGLR